MVSSIAKWLGALGVLYAVFWIWRHQTELKHAILLFHDVSLTGLVILFLLQFLYTLCLAASNRGVYLALEIQTTLWQQLLLVAASGVANRLIPSGGLSGIGSFFYLASKKGIPVSSSVKMTAISTVLGYLQIAPLAVFILAWLVWEGRHVSSSPSGTPVLLLTEVGIGVLATAFVAIAGVFLLAFPPFKKRMDAWQPQLRLTAKLTQTLAVASDYAVWTLKHRVQLGGPLSLLLVLFPIRILMLRVCFQSFHASMDGLQMTVAYIAAFLVSALSFLPTTLGVFETALITAFHWFGLPIEIGTAVTLLYRSFTFWVPIPFGLWSYLSFKS